MVSSSTTTAAAVKNRFSSSLSALPQHYPFDRDATRLKFDQIPDALPQLFLVVPPLGEPYHVGLHQAVRVIAPCQAPSIKSGGSHEGAFHLTAHKGYTIKCPRDLEHRYRHTIKTVAKLTKYIMRGAETAANYVGSLPTPATDLVASTLTSLCQTVDNKARLNRAGIDPSNLFSPQWVTDSHQKKAMEELVRAAAAAEGEHSITGDLNGIVLKNGRALWVCDRCYNSLRSGYPMEEIEDLTLSQYKSLVKGGSEIEVTLRNSTSVIVLIDVLNKSSNTNKIILHIEPKYFEAPERATGAPLNSIVHLFNELGQVLQGQKALAHLEIHGPSTNGEVFAGLQAVLKCRSLETLHLSGIPCFLQGENMTIRCRRLQDIELHGVLVNTEQAALNLEALIRRNAGLSRLKVTQAEFTYLSWSTLYMNRPKTMHKRFAQLERLDLSCNDLQMIHFVNSNPHLAAMLSGHRHPPRASYPI